MELIKILRQKVDSLGRTSCLPGLHSLLQHLEAAQRHLDPSATDAESEALTDSLYRTNQAFETAIREAYRVLTGRDPARQSIAAIEAHLDENHLLDERADRLITEFRKEWRNPLVHAHDLSFDESAAFLALITVTGISCLLIDQIAERLSYDSVKALTELQQPQLSAGLAATSSTLPERSAAILRTFASHLPRLTTTTQLSQMQIRLTGALSGFVASVAPDIHISTNAAAGPARAGRYLVFADEAEKILVDLKSAERPTTVSQDVEQLERCVREDEYCGAILFVCSHEPHELQCVTRELSYLGAPLVILSPAERPVNSAVRVPTFGTWPACAMNRTSSRGWVC